MFKFNYYIDLFFGKSLEVNKVKVKSYWPDYLFYFGFIPGLLIMYYTNQWLF